MMSTQTAETITDPAPDAAAPSSEPAILADGLTKRYGDRHAIRDVSFQVGSGEILGFLGPNGAGKTTTMRILTGYTPASAGRAFVAGFDVARQSLQARGSIGYLPEHTPLYDDMRVRDYLAFMCELKRCPAARRKSAVNRAVEECGLEEVSGRLISNLSRGYRQRVGLAQAVLADPAVLILDEPTVGLDPRQIVGIRRLIREMAGRRTVLLSTHILPEVSMICDRVVVIDRGRVVAAGTPDRLVAEEIDDPPIEILVSGSASAAADAAGRVRGVLGVTPGVSRDPGRHRFMIRVAPGDDPRAEISRAVVSAGAGLIEISRPGATLEEMFLRVLAAGERAPQDEASANEPSCDVPAAGGEASS